VEGCQPGRDDLGAGSAGCHTASRSRQTPVVAYMSEGWPVGLDAEIAEHLAKLEDRMGRRLGDPDEPLLVSVRSGAKFSDARHDGHRLEPSVSTTGRSQDSPSRPMTSGSRSTRIGVSCRCTAASSSASRAINWTAARGLEGAHRLPLGRRVAGGGAARLVEELKGRRRASDGQSLPTSADRPASRCDRGRVRLVERGESCRLPHAGAHPERSRHGGERAGDGLREPRRPVRYGRRLHTATRPPGPKEPTATSS